MELLNMIKFQMKVMLKSPMILYSYFVMPLMLTTIIGYLAKDSFGSNISSYEYYSISMTLLMFVGAGIGSVYNFMDPTLRNGNIRSIYSPIKISYIYLSQVLSGTVVFTIALIFNMTIYKVLFGINYNGNGLLIFGGFTSLIFISVTLGIFLCTVMKDVNLINVIFNLAQIFLSMLGGAFFSMEALGEIPAMISKLSPVKWVLDGILNSMYDNSNSLLFIIIAINISIGAILICLCKVTFKTEKYV